MKIERFFCFQKTQASKPFLKERARRLLFLKGGNDEKA